MLMVYFIHQLQFRVKRILLHEGGRVEGIIMDKWECTVCGWIYDPAVGDPDGGILPGTPFEKIPDTWVCPVCGASKDAFVKK